MKLSKTSYGTMPDGTPVDAYTLENGRGLRVRLIPYGATLIAVETPDRHGRWANITLYLDSLSDYLAGHPFFGCIAGRYANRIAKARFSIDGVEYRLAANERGNQLHGGPKGFDKHLWKAEPFERDREVGVRLTLTSPDGDQGFPGMLTATVVYAVTADDELRMEYTATTDKPTHVNLTNHAYWNLAGAGSGSVLDHELLIAADSYLPVDAELIPLGAPQAVKDTPLDFTQPRRIGERIAQLRGGYDHCLVLRKPPGERFALAARVVEPTSGRVMEVWTTQPGVQFYTANTLSGKFRGGNVAYGAHGGLCLEMQHFPDSPNRLEYPSTLLRPGETYHELTVHRFRARQ